MTLRLIAGGRHFRNGGTSSKPGVRIHRRVTLGCKWLQIADTGHRLLQVYCRNERCLLDPSMSGRLPWTIREAEKYRHRTIKTHEIFGVESTDTITHAELWHRRDFIHH